MIGQMERARLQSLLADAIALLCRNGVPFRLVHRVDALIGITLDDEEVVLIRINELLADEVDCAVMTEDCKPFGSNTSCTETSATDGNEKSHELWQNGICQHGIHERKSCTQQHKNKSSSSSVGVTNGTEERLNVNSEVADNCVIHSCVAAQAVGREVAQDQQMSHCIERLAGISEETLDESCAVIKSETSPGLQCLDVNKNPLAVNVDACSESSLSSCVLQPLPISATSNHGSCRSQRRHKYHAKYQAVPHQSRVFSAPHVEADQSFGIPDKLTETYSPASNCSTSNRSMMSDRQSCCMCGAWLCGPQALRDHIRGTHLSIHSYHCDYCGQSFKWRSTLRSHKFTCQLAPVVNQPDHRSDFSTSLKTEF